MLVLMRPLPSQLVSHVLMRLSISIFTMGRHTLDFPLRHPLHVTDHVAYRRRVYRIMAWRHPMIKFGRSFEEFWLNLRYGHWRRIFGALTGRLGILFRGRKFK